MKRSFYLTAFAIGLGFAMVASGGENDKPKAKTKTSTAEKAGTSTEGKTPITGTYIPRKIHRRGHITDGSAHVEVLDSDAIARSGASDLKQLLIRRGIR